MAWEYLFGALALKLGHANLFIRFCPCTSVSANQSVDADWKLPCQKCQLGKTAALVLSLSLG